MFYGYDYSGTLRYVLRNTPGSESYREYLGNFIIDMDNSGLQISYKDDIGLVRLIVGDSTSVSSEFYATGAGRTPK